MMSAPSTPASSKIQRTITPASTPGGTRSREEKILVTVRVRPLNRRELALYDLPAWDCPDEQTIVYQSPNQNRPSNSYSFDKVFDYTCSNQKVYEEGAKDVALSALGGINATIFAYGQTSSGKTYTMRGVTENAVKDIYEHINNTPGRDFVLRVSALEIYNETVVDLLNRNAGPLRLLDDPEKGTIAEKLVEEIVKDGEHLRHLIGICEAQRQVGETALNDKSSRSHQIIRLTIQSSRRQNQELVKSFIATLNLVDLAGSERVAQTNAGGARLKEGCHINRSLLTLTQVIRKLSCGKKSSHIPYRESKLTRILQSSLGGNARTAIICTISPALSHVEQTRNTLSFAIRAKEVTNNAQVNVVVSDKKLVKHLQKEVARLEAELLRSPEISSSSSLRTLLAEKDLKIQQLKMEMEEVKRQRDLAESQLESERKARKERKVINQCGPSSRAARCLSFSVEGESFSRKHTPHSGPRSAFGRHAAVRQSATSADPSKLLNEIRNLEVLQRQLGEEASQALEVLHREISSHRLGGQEAAENIANLLSDIKAMQVASSIPEDTVLGDKTNLKDEIKRLDSQASTIESLEKKLENVQNSIDTLVSSFPCLDKTSQSKSNSKKKKRNSANMHNLIRPPCSPLSSSRRKMDSDTENKAPNCGSSISGDLSPGPHKLSTPLSGDLSPGPHKLSTPLSRMNSNTVVSNEETPAKQPNSVDVKKMERMFKNAAEENIRSIKAYVTGLKERVAKLQYQKQLLVCQVLELEASEAADDQTDMTEQSPMPWHIVFEDQRKQIVMLWHLCHVSLIHRTQFFLLFKGDPADQIYMEVELRRLSWLEQHYADVGNASPALLGDDPASSVSSSIKALRQEREYLAKRVSSKLTAEEREMHYTKWDIPAVGKQRRQQLVNKLWTDPYDMIHVTESAELVAKLVGFCESGEHASKEMFQLNYVNPSDKKSWMGWNLISNLSVRKIFSLVE